MSNIAVSPGQYILSKSLFENVGGFADLQNKGTDDWGIFYSLNIQHPDTIITFRSEAVLHIEYTIHKIEKVWI